MLIGQNQSCLRFLSPPFRRKAEGHCFRHSVVRGVWRLVRGSEFLVGTLSP